VQEKITSSQNYYRIGVGDYRIIYEINYKEKGIKIFLELDIEKKHIGICKFAISFLSFISFIPKREKRKI
jgi:hypothetical protein